MGVTHGEQASPFRAGSPRLVDFADLGCSISIFESYYGMLWRQAYKFRTKATMAQKAIMAQTAGTSRFVWNSALAMQKSRLDRKDKLLTSTELCRELTLARNEPDLAFLRETHSKPQQQVFNNLFQAFKSFFKGDHDFPVFKKKGKSRDSFRFPQYQNCIQLEGNRIKLPALGWVRFYKSREILGKIKNVTVSKRENHWYISIQTEREIPDPVHPSSVAVGIDLGISKFAALSNGEVIRPISSFRKLESKLALEQRKSSKKKKFSKNWKKQKAVISRLHAKIANARKDFLHKASTRISKSHAMVYIEDLKVSNMSKSAKGSKKNPGKNVRAKSGLNKSILDQGWYEFRRQLTYKEQRLGGEVVAVPPQYTSQICAQCGHKSKENRRSQALFKCVACGHEDNADINAAKNILRVGQTLSVCGEASLDASAKQKPRAARKRRSQVA